MTEQRAKLRLTAAIAVFLAAVALGVGCGSGTDEDTVDPGSETSESALTVEEAEAPLAEAPPELVAVRDEASEILDEDSEAFEARLAEFADAGIPVVVNNWASWCGPCREEFPEFQSAAIEYGDGVAFIGLLSGDGPETGATFLEEFPTPYPSYLDADFDASIDIGTGKRLPSTAFYDSSGELAHLRSGPYDSPEDLAADIEEYTE